MDHRYPINYMDHKVPHRQKVCKSVIYTLPETNSSPLKMDGWNTTFLLGSRPIFREGRIFVWVSPCKNFPSFNKKMNLKPAIFEKNPSNLKNQGTVGCTPNSVPMVFIVLSRDSWGL